MGDMTAGKYDYQSISFKKDFARMIQDHISGDPRFVSMADFVRFAILKQMDRDVKNKGCKNYQPSEGDEESIIDGGYKNAKSQSNVGRGRGGVSDGKL